MASVFFFFFLNWIFLFYEAIIIFFASFSLGANPSFLMDIAKNLVLLKEEKNWLNGRR